jgi:hypothetical protein
MSDTRKIYSKGIINANDKNIVQKVKYNRTHLLSADVAKEFNTYLNFGIFPTFADTFMPYYDKDGKLIDNPNNKKSGIGTPGVRSLFNRAGAIVIGSSDGKYDIDIASGSDAHYWRISNNVPLMDSPEARRRIRKSSGCSVKELVKASQSGEMGQETYSYSDFMYCKHLGKVSNNYMVTLRRFPLPVDDYIGSIGEDIDTRLKRTSTNASCIGCMVTWMGVSGNDLSNILKYSYKMPFKETEAELQSNSSTSADNNTTLLNGIFSTFDKNYREQYMEGKAGEAGNAFFDHLGIKMGNPPYKNLTDFQDRNKVYGPIDTIQTTYMRSEGGLTFDQKISLVFEYELRSYNGINPKQAMLDLISNILNVTYTTGSFWGGGFKGYAAQQSNIFTNLKVFKAKGGFTNFVDAFFDDLSNFRKDISNKLGDPKSFFESAKEVLNGIGGMFLAGKLNALGRPQKGMYNSILSPAPIGFWHVTIGNPKRPIMSIGNMVITNVSIEHNGPLGLDDFPTGLKVTVDLDRGKPRDLRDIEKLYMQGTDRIYAPMGDKVFDMYKNAELYRNKHDYTPVTNTATVNEPADGKSKPTISVKNYEKLKGTMRKYFGTDDAYSIYVPATEQEYGSGKKKPSTEANKNLAGYNK